MSTNVSIDKDNSFLQEIQKDFLEETVFLLEQCEESYLRLEKPELRQEELRKIFRLAHSMKGAGASVGFTDLAKFAHVVEDCLTILRVNTHLVTQEVVSLLLRAGDAFKKQVKILKEKTNEPWDVSQLANEIVTITRSLEQAKIVAVSNTRAEAEKNNDQAPRGIQKTQTSSVKIDTDRIDAVLDMVGELVVLKSQLINETMAYHSNLKLNALVSLMEKSIRELQDKSLGMRMTPLKSLFLKTQRVVRDLSVKLGKPVDFEMSGEDTEIDRTMVELLADPLMHLARNALDHGIEKAELRKAKQKLEKGKIHLSAQQLGGRVIIKITDDGAGINKDQILKKAIEKGIIPPNKDPASIALQEIYQFIFAPGFSTAAVVTDVSGRGVGLDVVKSNIEKLKGSIEIKTETGKGSAFIISIPLTTSITDGMQVRSAGQNYILPLDTIRELMDIQSDMLTEMHNGQELLNVRGKLLPVLDLDLLLSSFKPEKKTVADAISKTIVVVEGSKGLLALRVQSIVGQVQVVLKSLGDYFSNTSHRNCVAGAAILGDGKVALVLDIDSIETNPMKAAAA